MQGSTSPRSRRTVLVGASAVLAGCSGFPGGGSTRDPATSSRAPATNEPSGSSVATSTPTCADTDADQVVVVEPRGFTVVAVGRDRATRIRETLVTADDAELRIDDAAVSLVDLPDSDRVAVEMDDGATEIGELERFRGTEGVVAVRKGRSLPTLRNLGSTVRSQLGETDAVRPDRIEVRYVRPRPPRAMRFVVLLWGVGDASVLERSTDFAIRVGTDDGERTLVTGTDVAAAEVTASRDTPAASLRIAPDARERFRRGLAEAGALDDPRAHPLRVYSRGTMVYEATLSGGLVEDLRRGAWAETGTFLVRFESEADARRVARALGVLWLSVAAATSVEVCGSA